MEVFSLVVGLSRADENLGFLSALDQTEKKLFSYCSEAGVSIASGEHLRRYLSDVSN